MKYYKEINAEYARRFILAGRGDLVVQFHPECFSMGQYFEQSVGTGLKYDDIEDDCLYGLDVKENSYVFFRESGSIDIIEADNSKKAREIFYYRKNPKKTVDVKIRPKGKGYELTFEPDTRFSSSGKLYRKTKIAAGITKTRIRSAHYTDNRDILKISVKGTCDGIGNKILHRKIPITTTKYVLRKNKDKFVK